MDVMVMYRSTQHFLIQTETIISHAAVPVILNSSEMKQNAQKTPTVGTPVI